jgi:predicted transcriptional regulator
MTYASICHMKRTTIFVPESLERDLQLYARREGKPTAAIVREALAEYVARRTTRRQLPSFAGAFASGRSDTAEHHEALLFEHVTPHPSTRAARAGQVSSTRGSGRGAKTSRPVRRRRR